MTRDELSELDGYYLGKLDIFEYSAGHFLDEYVDDEYEDLNLTYDPDDKSLTIAHIINADIKESSSITISNKNNEVYDFICAIIKTIEAALKPYQKITDWYKEHHEKGIDYVIETWQNAKYPFDDEDDDSYVVSSIKVEGKDIKFIINADNDEYPVMFEYKNKVFPFMWYSTSEFGTFICLAYDYMNMFKEFKKDLDLFTIE